MSIPSLFDEHYRQSSPTAMRVLPSVTRDRAELPVHSGQSLPRRSKSRETDFTHAITSHGHVITVRNSLTETRRASGRKRELRCARADPR